MTRLQTALLLTLLALASVMAVQASWEMVVPPLASAWHTLPALVGSVPGWVWWTVLGSVWWLPWAVRGCGRSACARSAS